MPLSYLRDGGYSLGMIRDDPSWMIPQGGVYDSLNLVYDKPGIARQRMGTLNLVSGAQTAFATSIGFVYSQNSSVTIEELYGINGKTGAMNVINKSTGAATSIGGTAVSGSGATIGRGVRHFGFLVFPFSDTGAAAREMVTVAGQTSGTTFTNAATAAVAAGNQQITLSGADVTTNVKVGAIVTIHNLTQLYTGRVVSIDTTKLFTVWPVPTWTDAAIPIGNVTTLQLYPAFGGSCATSFQNRLLVGNTNDMGSTGQTLTNDRRIYYSPLPTESNTDPAGTGNINGANFVQGASNWPRLNFLDISGADPIVAMEPISDGELIILTSRDLHILVGNLVTQLATTSPTITYDVYPLGTTNGCLSDLSVHRTPVGIMWAGNEGVFAYWPPLRRNPAKTGIRNLMDNKILTHWQTLVNPSAGSFVIHGAAYVRNHYVVSGTSNGVTFSLACNLHNDQWTRLSGAGTDIFTSVARPSIPQQVYAARWWDQTGAAPSMTNGQTVRLETMLNPYVTGATTTDADGSAVPILAQTQTITGDAEAQKMFQRGTVEYQQSSTTAAVTVTAQSTIDAADTDASRTRTLGNLSNTATSTITNATNAAPIVVTTSSAHGLQTDDFVDIDAVLGNLNANGQYRIAVSSTTQFSLVGSSGSAAYTSGGKVKKRTEQTFQMTPLNKGQGASITVSGSPNYFELHGVKLAVLQQEQVPA